MTDIHLLWLDLETTHDNPDHPRAAILEIGAVITNSTPELTHQAQASLLVRPPGDRNDVELTWQSMSPVVRDMHDHNGLWREATTNPDAWSIWEADVALAGWITQQTSEGSTIALAGSGTAHLDRPFMVKHMPHTMALLTYWTIDIGTIRRTLGFAGRTDLVQHDKHVEAKPHRALADALLHTDEARYYLQLLHTITT